MVWYLRNLHLDLYGCDREICSREFLQKILIKTPDEISMKAFMKPFIRDDTVGLMGYLGMETSQLIIETYPSTGTTLVDASTCGPCDVDKTTKYFVDEFGAKSYEVVYAEGKIPKGPLRILLHKSSKMQKARVVNADNVRYQFLVGKKEIKGKTVKRLPSLERDTQVYSTSIPLTNVLKINKKDLGDLKHEGRSDIHLFKPQGETVLSFRVCDSVPRAGFYANTWPEYGFGAIEHRVLRLPRSGVAVTWPELGFGVISVPTPHSFSFYKGSYDQVVIFGPNVLNFQWDLIRKNYTARDSHLYLIQK